MYLEIKRYGIRINTFVPVGLVFFVLLNGVLASAVILFAAFIHEAGHILIANAVGAPIMRFDIEPWGGRIYYGGMTSYKQELAISLGGILFNLIFAPLGLIPALGVYGKMFFCGCIIYSLVNIIPMKSLDGGEVLRCLLCIRTHTLSEYGTERIVHFVSSVFMLVLCGVVCVASGFNLSVIFISVFSVVLAVTELLQKQEAGQ